MRYRFVEQIVNLKEGSVIHCRYRWPEDLDIFQDHFPAFPVVPGVLLTEMMGQSASLCIESALPDAGLPMLIQIADARFRDWVKPGSVLDIHAEVISAQTRLAKVKSRTDCAGKIVATSELLFSFQSKADLGLPLEDPLLTAWYADHARPQENAHD